MNSERERAWIAITAEENLGLVVMRGPLGGRDPASVAATFSGFPTADEHESGPATLLMLIFIRFCILALGMYCGNDWVLDYSEGMTPGFHVLQVQISRTLPSRCHVLAPRDQFRL